MNKDDQRQYNELTEELKFNPHELDIAVVQQSELYQKVQDHYVNAVSQRDLSKKFLEETYANVSLGIRNDANSKGSKLTEDFIKQMTLLDLDYQEATTRWLEAKNDSELWAALKESYSSRGFMIKTMAQLWIANYFTSTTIRDTENTLPEVQHHQARTAMALKRRELKT